MRVSRLLAVTHWLKDDVFRRLFRNAGMLLGGDVAGSVLGLAALALTARVLGIEDFATFTLVQTYVMVLSRVVNFQSWQALIKYGAEALRQERYGDFRQLIRLGTLLDACTAVLGAGVSVAAIFWVGPWMGWDASTVRMAAIASVVILFEVVGTPVAALRLFDRFKTLAVLNVVGNAFKLAAVSVAWLSGGSIWAFVVAWLCTRLMHQTLLLLCGWTVLLRQGMGERVRDFLRRQGAGLVQLGLGRFLSYSVHASLAGTVRSVCRDSILFLVGALLGKGYVAYYKVMLGISSVLPRLARPLFDAVYPEFARAVGAGAHDKVRELSFRLNVLFSVLLASWIVPYLLVGKRQSQDGGDAQGLLRHHRERQGHHRRRRAGPGQPQAEVLPDAHGALARDDDDV